MTHDDNAPATRADVAQLRDTLKAEMKGEITAMKEEILRHFDVTVENIRHDLAGANRDEIEVLKDTKTDHEHRLTKLETVAGLRA